VVDTGMRLDHSDFESSKGQEAFSPKHPVLFWDKTASYLIDTSLPFFQGVKQPRRETDY